MVLRVSGGPERGRRANVSGIVFPCPKRRARQMERDVGDVIEEGRPLGWPGLVAMLLRSGRRRLLLCWKHLVCDHVAFCYWVRKMHLKQFAVFARIGQFQFPESLARCLLLIIGGGVQPEIARRDGTSLSCALRFAL